MPRDIAFCANARLGAISDVIITNKYTTFFGILRSFLIMTCFSCFDLMNYSLKIQARWLVT
jgi:hypothetical protein